MSVWKYPFSWSSAVFSKSLPLIPNMAALYKRIIKKCQTTSCSLFIYYNQSFFRRIFIPGEGVCYCAKRKSQRVKADFLKAHFHQFACLVFLLQIIWFSSFITVLISVNIFCPSSEIGNDIEKEKTYFCGIF